MTSPGDAVATMRPRGLVADYRSHAVRKVSGKSAVCWCGLTRPLTDITPSTIKPCEECLARIGGTHESE
jgi:hypothetical protein